MAAYLRIALSPLPRSASPLIALPITQAITTTMLDEVVELDSRITSANQGRRIDA